MKPDYLDLDVAIRVIAQWFDRNPDAGQPSAACMECPGEGKRTVILGHRCARHLAAHLVARLDGDSVDAGESVSPQRPPEIRVGETFGRCECLKWGREEQWILTEHHQRCRHYGAEVAKLLCDCLAAMRRWGAEEDGIPDFAAEVFDEVALRLGKPLSAPTTDEPPGHDHDPVTKALEQLHEMSTMLEACDSARLYEAADTLEKGVNRLRRLIILDEDGCVVTQGAFNALLARRNHLQKTLDDTRKACACNCHDPDARMAMNMSECANCGECCAAIAKEGEHIGNRMWDEAFAAGLRAAYSADVEGSSGGPSEFSQGKCVGVQMLRSAIRKLPGWRDAEGE